MLRTDEHFFGGVRIPLAVKAVSLGKAERPEGVEVVAERWEAKPERLGLEHAGSAGTSAH